MNSLSSPKLFRLLTTAPPGLVSPQTHSAQAPNPAEGNTVKNPRAPWTSALNMEKVKYLPKREDLQLIKYDIFWGYKKDIL